MRELTPSDAMIRSASGNPDRLPPPFRRISWTPSASHRRCRCSEVSCGRYRQSRDRRALRVPLKQNLDIVPVVEGVLDFCRAFPRPRSAWPAWSHREHDAPAEGVVRGGCAPRHGYHAPDGAFSSGGRKRPAGPPPMQTMRMRIPSLGNVNAVPMRYYFKFKI